MLMVCHHLDPGDRRGHRVRRIADPPRDDRRRGHPARPRRVLDAVVGLAGDGPRRRGDHPHVADRAQDEGAARQARQRPGRARQLPREALHRQVHDQSGDRARHRARRRLGRARQARRSRAVEAGVLRREAVADPQGRHDRRGGDGRSRTRRFRRRSRCTTGRCSARSAGARDVGHVRVEGRAQESRGAQARAREAARRGRRTRARSASGT